MEVWFTCTLQYKSVYNSHPKESILKFLLRSGQCGLDRWALYKGRYRCDCIHRQCLHTSFGGFYRPTYAATVTVCQPKGNLFQMSETSRGELLGSGIPSKKRKPTYDGQCEKGREWHVNSHQASQAILFIAVMVLIFLPPFSLPSPVCREGSARDGLPAQRDIVNHGR